jgi:hypothetical protein
MKPLDKKYDLYRYQLHRTLGGPTWGALANIPGPNGSRLHVIFSDGMGWDHVSVSLKNRCPTWEEMCYVKEIFFELEDCVIQFHPPKSDYKNAHPYCLHLWRCQEQEFPRPPSITVAP